MPCVCSFSGDLFHYLKNLPAGGLAEEDGASVFSQILAGVGYAHNQHICHRDLKLENILLPKYALHRACSIHSFSSCLCCTSR